MDADDALRYNQYWDDVEKGLYNNPYGGKLSLDEISRMQCGFDKIAQKNWKYELGLDRYNNRILDYHNENAIKGGTTSTKPYTNSRPSFRKGVVDEVWENAKGPDGLVRDPNTGDIINWNPGESRKGVWDMGHIPEAKYSEMHEAYMNGDLTTIEFVDWYNDPANYRPELPSNNRSHKYE